MFEYSVETGKVWNSKQHRPNATINSRVKGLGYDRSNKK